MFKGYVTYLVYLSRKQGELASPNSSVLPDEIDINLIFCSARI